jgi:hypothetical protein
MKRTDAKLTEMAANAAELRRQAHVLEEEQSTLDRDRGEDQDRYFMLGVKINELLEQARNVERPVIDAMDDDLQS